MKLTKNLIYTLVNALLLTILCGTINEMTIARFDWVMIDSPAWLTFTTALLIVSGMSAFGLVSYRYKDEHSWQDLGRTLFNDLIGFGFWTIILEIIAHW